MDNNLPWRFNRAVDRRLGWWMSTYELGGGCPVLDTYLELGEQGKHSRKPLGVLLLRFFGQADGLGQSLMFVIFRGDRIDLAEIDGDVGVDPLLGDL